MNPSMLMQGLSEQTLIFLRSLLLGILLGAAYDVLRVTRVMLGVRYRHAGAVRLRSRRLPLLPETNGERFRALTQKLLPALIFAGDVLFSLLCAAVLSVFLYHYNYGIIRWYVFLGALLGFIAYYNTVGRIVIWISDILVYVIKVALRYLFHFTVHPVVLLFSKAAERIKRKKKPEGG